MSLDLRPWVGAPTLTHTLSSLNNQQYDRKEKIREKSKMFYVRTQSLHSLLSDFFPSFVKQAHVIFKIKSSFPSLSQSS